MIHNLRCRLAFWIMPDDFDKELMRACADGWFASNARRLLRFCNDEMSKASGGKGFSAKFAGVFSLIAGHEVEFKLIKGGPVYQMYNSETPLLARIKKSYCFAGETIREPLSHG